MKNTNARDIKRNWHLVDAKGRVIGRLASSVAILLMGKNKNYYAPYFDTGDYVVVINAKNALFTGKKEKQKKYFRHSGYPGGLKETIASQIRMQKPEFLIRHAVAGMLPKNKLGKTMLKKLFVYESSDHPYKERFSIST